MLAGLPSGPEIATCGTRALRICALTSSPRKWWARTSVPSEAAIRVVVPPAAWISTAKSDRHRYFGRTPLKRSLFSPVRSFNSTATLLSCSGKESFIS